MYEDLVLLIFVTLSLKTIHMVNQFKWLEWRSTGIIRVT